MVSAATAKPATDIPQPKAIDAVSDFNEPRRFMTKLQFNKVKGIVGSDSNWIQQILSKLRANPPFTRPHHIGAHLSFF
jgi:hypothetical protein